MSQHQPANYLVIQMYDPIQGKLTEEMCIPADWVQTTMLHGQTLLYYPLEEKSVTELRIQNGEAADTTWPVRFGTIIATEESYQAAIRFITEKNNRDHSTTGNEPMVHATIINGSEVMEPVSSTSKKCTDESQSKKPSKRKHLGHEDDSKCDDDKSKKLKETVASSTEENTNSQRNSESETNSNSEINLDSKKKSNSKDNLSSKEQPKTSATKRSNKKNNCPDRVLSLRRRSRTKDSRSLIRSRRSKTIEKLDAVRRIPEKVFTTKSIKSVESDGDKLNTDESSFASDDVLSSLVSKSNHEIPSQAEINKLENRLVLSDKEEGNQAIILTDNFIEMLIEAENSSENPMSTEQPATQMSSDKNITKPSNSVSNSGLSTKRNSNLQDISSSKTGNLQSIPSLPLPNSETNTVNKNGRDVNLEEKIFHELMKLKNDFATKYHQINLLIDWVKKQYGLPSFGNENHCSSLTNQVTANNQEISSENRSSVPQSPTPSVVSMPESYCNNDTKWTLRYHNPGPGLIELMPYTGVYVSEAELTQCRILAKDMKNLARALLPLVFTKEALKTCTFTGNKPKVPIAESFVVRPGLDLNGRNTLITYAYEYGKKAGWAVTDPVLIMTSLKNKLQVQKYRNKDK